ncbi:hypothetical protein ABZS98_27855 [Streptomyces avermitilis]|uniref:hypothetical protein n=1 Tax=Streptomyces avermitilis TaxID=33903 RepID=UPI0033A2E136
MTRFHLSRPGSHAGGGAQAAYIAAVFLIECMQEVDQFLVDIRGNVGAGYGQATA